MSFRWVILGAGRVAADFAEAARHVAGCELAAVASRTPAHARAFAQAHGVPRAYDTYEAMLSAEKPDAAYIAVTTNAHAALVRLCIDHGIPVLCEKAMFMSAAEARETLAFARERGVFAMEAMWARFMPGLREAKRLLAAGAIGQPYYAVFDMSWQVPQGSAALDRRAGGGLMYYLTVYGYEVLDFLFGPPRQAQPEQVEWDENGVDMQEELSLSWPDMLADVRMSFRENRPEYALICGTEGRMRIPLPTRAGAVYCERADGRTSVWEDAQTVHMLTPEVEEVVRCVRAGLTESPTVPHDLTIRCAEMFDAINATREPKQ